MGAYESIVMTVFFLLAAVCGWNGVRSYQRAGAETEKEPRAAGRRKGIFWITLGLMLALSALYILFRRAWLLSIVMLAGSLSVAYVIGSGLGTNMREH